jgi:hypothetical protein
VAVSPVDRRRGLSRRSSRPTRRLTPPPLPARRLDDLAPRIRAWLPFVAIAGVLTALVLQLAVGYAHVSGDTQLLVTGSQSVLDCLDDGQLVACEAVPAPTYSAVGPFAPLQYVPTVVALGLGASATFALNLLWLLSIGAFLALIVLVWWTLGRADLDEWSPVLVVVMLTGPLLFYANSTFGEMLAAFLSAAVVATLVLRSSWLLVALAAFLAGLTKETAPAVLLALGAVVVLARSREAGTRARRLAPLVAGVLLAVVANAAFNVFRYGTVTNELYLHVFEDDYGIDSVPLERRLDFFAGLLVSPNGGIAAFWPAATLLIAATGIGAVLAARERGRAGWLPGAALLATFVGLNAAFASLPYPFGWHAWGPRYTVAWVPAFALAAVALYGPELGRLLGRALRPRAVAVAAAAALALAALPHVGLVLEPGRFADLFAPDAVCADGARGEAFLACVSHQAWERPSILARGATVPFERSPQGVWLAAAFAGATLVLVLAARGRLLRGAPDG